MDIANSGNILCYTPTVTKNTFVVNECDKKIL